MRVIGTAGHVDHGKSTLVRALTGIDPDRLKEEKEREMTIDLGFAWLTLPSGLEVSIVDVPGHEDFIKNMLAGVGGIDLALFVVAADEGVMPQTREHLAILDLLQVQSGVVALTKSDLVQDQEWLELVSEEVREELAGTLLEKARIIPVSARTGAGLASLLDQLDRLLQAPSSRPQAGQPRLPIDRVFTIAGFGTVVTGTLIDGPFHVGDDVQIVPGEIRARIRGLQTHKQKVQMAAPPSRVAVNLSGVTTEQLARGDVVTSPGWLHPTLRLDGRLEVLPSTGRPLRHNTVVDFFTGAAQCEARIRILDRKEIEPGQEGWAQILLSQPIAVLKGDRFIVRQASPSMTLGGGEIVDPHPQRRHRRFRSATLERLEQLAHGTPEEILLQQLEREQPTEIAGLLKQPALPSTEAEQTLLALLNSGQAVLLDSASNKNWSALPARSQYVMSAAGWSELLDKTKSLLLAYHRRYPLRAGMPREELKSRLGLEPRAFAQAILKAVADKDLVENAALVALADHQVALSPEEKGKVSLLMDAFARSPYAPPSVAECESVVGSEILAALVEQGRLVKLGESVLFSAQIYRTMTDTVVEFLQREGHITLAQVRDMFGTSRKYAQALLERLDEKRVTKRVGDERILF
jgi:selenocysteine-specific elongation factor